MRAVYKTREDEMRWVRLRESAAGFGLGQGSHEMQHECPHKYPICGVLGPWLDNIFECVVSDYDPARHTLQF